MLGVVALAVTVSLVVGGASGGIDHPDEWDPRVEVLVAFVEAERGLGFDHPVHVDFLTAEEYSAVVRSDPDDLTDDEREELDDLVAMLRALGLVAESFDVAEATDELVDQGTLAFYSWEDRRIRVRGTEIDIGLEVTLVHELVHALQDQHFDLSRMQEFETSGEATVLRALAEGDATLVEGRYLDSLPAEDRERHDTEAATAVEDVDLEAVPDVLVALFSAPYALGIPIVELVEATDGWAGVDAILAEPPTTEAELFQPSRLEDRPPLVEVDAPELAAGDEQRGEGDFGALTLFLALAARLDPLDAMYATDRWAGDRYLEVVDDEGRLCVVLAVAVTAPLPDEPGDLEAALRDWVAAGPPEAAASVSTSGGIITVRTCDPGEGTLPEPRVSSADVLVYPALRAYLWSAYRPLGMAVPEVECMASTLLTELPVEVLVDPDPADDDVAQIQALVVRSMSECQRS